MKHGTLICELCLNLDDLFVCLGIRRNQGYRCWCNPQDTVILIQIDLTTSVSDVTSHIQISWYLNTPLHNRDMPFLNYKVFSFWWKTPSGGCFRKGIHIDGMVSGANTSLPYLMMIKFRPGSVFFYIKRIVF